MGGDPPPPRHAARGRVHPEAGAEPSEGGGGRRVSEDWAAWPDGALGGEADEDEAEEAARRRFDAAPADAAAAGGAAGGLDAIPEGEANQAVDLRQYV